MDAEDVRRRSFVNHPTTRTNQLLRSSSSSSSSNDSSVRTHRMAAATATARLHHYISINQVRQASQVNRYSNQPINVSSNTATSSSRSKSATNVNHHHSCLINDHSSNNIREYEHHHHNHHNHHQQQQQPEHSHSHHQYHHKQITKTKCTRSLSIDQLLMILDLLIRLCHLMQQYIKTWLVRYLPSIAIIILNRWIDLQPFIVNEQRAFPRATPPPPPSSSHHHHNYYQQQQQNRMANVSGNIINCNDRYSNYIYILNN